MKDTDSSTRAMSRNETEYPEPDKFKPERWMAKEGGRHPLDARKIAFGFGRRCETEVFSLLKDREHIY